MSADNWTVCPRCEAARREKAKRLADEVTASYGRVHPDEYEALKAEARVLLVSLADTTLREDYEIGIFQGEFSINYGASCEAPGCGFNFEFQQDKKVK